MKELTLQKLHCVTTEDILGSDECRLEVITDGQVEHPERVSLNDGEAWAIDANYYFRTEATVQLLDEDIPEIGDDDDHLGIVRIPSTDVTDAVAQFCLDEADYRLVYSVREATLISDPHAAETAVQAFEAAPEPSPKPWPSIDKAALVQDIRDTLADVTMGIDQQNWPFCGPASVAFELATREPRRWVEILQSIYEKGSFPSRHEADPIEAGDALRNAQPPTDLSLADWLFMGTIQDDANLILSVTNWPRGLAAGISWHTVMADWHETILFCDNVSTDFAPGDDLVSLRNACANRDRGGYSMIGINSALIPGQSSTPIDGVIPTHWVPLYKDPSDPATLIETEQTVSFKVYSWGQIHTIYRQKGDWESLYFGSVTGLRN
jgi:hypothetical protein